MAFQQYDPNDKFGQGETITNNQYDSYSGEVREMENNFPAFLSRVFFIMFLGLAMSTAIAYLTLTSDYLYMLMINMYSSTGMMFAVFIGYLALAVIMTRAVAKMNVGLASVLFFLYSAVTGFMFSSFGIIYTVDSIWKAFLAAGIFFGLLAFVGVVIKKDLSRFRTILMVALFALIIVSVVNIFMRSAAFDLFVTILGLVIFAAYTVYDINMIKRLYAQMYQNEVAVSAIAVYAAFSLYLDFINIFIRLLTLFGRRRN